MFCIISYCVVSFVLWDVHFMKDIATWSDFERLSTVFYAAVVLWLDYFMVAKLLGKGGRHDDQA